MAHGGILIWQKEEEKKNNGETRINDCKLQAIKKQTIVVFGFSIYVYV